jgi:hypothetical protein
MKVLFDQNVPKNLIPYLSAHEVTRSYALGWQNDKDGTLLKKAESAGFQVFVTGDKNIVYQQNLSSLAISVVELSRTNWPQVKPHVHRIVDSVNSCVAGSYIRVAFSA